ncbi:MAG: hypothetical protein ACI8PZ_004431 [Myxococcota bacterium]|jgi:hypothetical protein
MLGVGLAAAVLAPGSAAASEVEAVRRFALLVGHNDGGPERPVLRYAHTDATAMHDVLVELGGVDIEDARQLSDPSADDLREALSDLMADVHAATGRTEVVLYYSGHSDETGLILGEGTFEYAELRAVVDALDADARIAILDSCASGSIIRTKGGTHKPPFLVDEASRVDGVAYLTSSSEDESSQEAERLQGSFFTHFLTSGMRGAADSSGDSRVSLQEAYTYAQQETLSRTERTQYGPQHAGHSMNLTGTGVLVLTDLRQVDSTLVLAEGLVGRVSLRTPDGALVAEIDKRAGRDLSLALPDGRYIATLSDGGRFAEAHLEVSDSTSALLSASDLVWTNGELTAARGDVQMAAVELQNSPARVSFAPLPGDEERLDRAVFHLGASRSGGLNGFAGGLGVSMVDADARGGMVTFGANLVDGELRGVQGAFGYNQARSVHGVQLALGANVAHQQAHGVQAALGFNGAVGTGSIVQAAVGVNMLDGDFDGLQVAGAGVNIADGLRGAQIGLVNIGGRVHGAQIGLVNIAHDVEGVQFGLVNIANELRGTPVGLLSISKNGRYDLGVFGSASDVLNADFKIGGRAGLYTVLGGGGQPGEHFYLAAGLGVHAPLGAAWLDIDVTTPVYQQTQTAWQRPPTVLLRSRAIVGVPITSWLAPFAGVTFDWRAPTDGAGTVATIPARWVGDATADQVVVAWPGFVAGVSF